MLGQIRTVDFERKISSILVNLSTYPIDTGLLHWRITARAANTNTNLCVNSSTTVFHFDVVKDDTRCWLSYVLRFQ
jgi:hypothetical protein